MVVDAEQHVDVGMGLEGIEAGAERRAEDAAAVDPPVPHLAVEGVGEAGEESVAPRPGVGQRLERHDQDPRRLDLAREVARRRLAEVAARRHVVGAEIGAAGLRRGFGEERDAPAPRHQAERLGALAFERRQHDRVGIVDGKADVLGRGRRAVGRLAGRTVRPSTRRHGSAGAHPPRRDGPRRAAR